jgi:glycosyltransferase involved in cell wall biosynthesis
MCRAYAETFNWSGIAARHAAIYNRAIAPGPRRPRVVFVDHCALLSGGELAMLKLLPALDRVDAHVILAEDGPLVARLRRAGVSVEVMPLDARAARLGRDRVSPGRLPLGTLFLALRYTVRLARRLRRLRPEVVHANSLKSGFYGLAAARMAGAPAVWHIRDRIVPDYLPSFAVRLVRLWARLAPAAVIANSQSTAETLPACRNLTVVPSPVQLTPAPDQRPPGGPLVIGMVGRLMPWKGQDVFLRAFAEAFGDGDARAVLVGSAMFGQELYERSLKKLAAGLGIESRLDMKGFRSDVAAELAGFDVLVAASVIPEPFGGAVVEGMAAGLPVVAPAAGGPLETVTDGVNGLLYPPGDSHELAVRLRRLADDPGLRSRLGAAAAVRSRDFTPQKVAEQVVAVYRAVLEGASS